MIDILVIKKEKVKDSHNALNLMGSGLNRMGYVSSSFAKACIEREIIYPTGLPNKIPVAIPHADSKFVKKDAICVLKLDVPVCFKRMDNPEKNVFCSWLFNIALTKGDSHIETLQRLMSIIQNYEEFNLLCEESNSNIKEFFYNKLNKKTI